MKRGIWLLSIALLTVAAAEFGLLGAASAGASFVPSWLGASKGDAPALRQAKTPCPTSHGRPCTPTPAPTPASPPSTPVSPPPCLPDRQHEHDPACAGQPASMQLTPDPLTIHCDGSESSTITVRVTAANGQPVPDGTTVYFSAYNGTTTPGFAQTQKGVASTSVVFYGELFKGGPNVIVDAGVFEAGVRVRCFPNSNPQPPSPPPCPLSPPSSPPCLPPPPPPCNPVGSPPSISPPCPTPTATPTPYPTPTPSIGGEISFGTPSLVNGNIVVPVLTTASQDPYRAFQVHLVFDGSLLGVTGAQVGNVLEGSGGTFCLPLLTVDGGNGAQFACTVLGSGSTTQAGTLATFTLSPQAAACVPIHLFTYGPPDGGDANTGTFTVSDAQTVQQNTYGPDITVDLATGATGCTPSATPVPTATPGSG